MNMKKFILNYEKFNMNDHEKLEMLKKIEEVFRILVDEKTEMKEKYLDNISFDIAEIYLDMVNDGLIEPDNDHVHDISLVGRNYGSLTEEEKKSLGDPDPDIWKDGNVLRHFQAGEDVIVDFENGLSVPGRLEGEDLEIVIDDDAIIYDSAHPELLETETKSYEEYEKMDLEL